MKLQLVIIFFLVSLLMPSLSFSRERIRIVGSSTLYPFVALVAERFSKTSQFSTPVVETTGTGGGINLLCSGNNLDFPDIVSASRMIKQSEIRRCRQNKVNNIQELLVGYDGIVISSSFVSPKYNFTKQDIFLALASFVPKNGKLVKNHYKYWNQINPALPRNKIEVYGPSFNSGTRDAFIELVMMDYCLKRREFKTKYKKIDERRAACRMLRRDGAYIEMGDNDNVTIHKIESNTTSLGIISYNFYDERRSSLRAAEINNVKPSYDNIVNKKYPIARSLYLYINKDHIGQVPGIKEFIAEFSNKNTVGSYGYLTIRGLITHQSILSKQRKLHK